jgi:hypothetical protein
MPIYYYKNSTAVAQSSSKWSFLLLLANAYSLDQVQLQLA